MMRFGRKGANWGAVIIIIAFIGMLVIGIITAAIQTGGIAYDPQSVIDYYKNIFSEENLEEPFTLVITLFVPFISTFAMTWAFVGILPVFRDRNRHPNADRAAAVLALGLSLYVMPAMNFFITSFFPWSLAIAAIMIAVGLIGKSLHWGVVPFVETAEGMAGAGRRAQAAWRGEAPPSEAERERREITERQTDLSRDWQRALEGHRRILRGIRNFHIDNNIRNLSESEDWRNLCDTLTNLDDAKRRANGILRNMIQSLQTIDEFRNLFRDNPFATTYLPQLQESFREIHNLHGAGSRNLETVNTSDTLHRQHNWNVMNELVSGYSSILNSYNEFFDFERSDAGNLTTLRTKTIDELGIQF